METFHPPPPLLPDLVSSPTGSPRLLETQNVMTNCSLKQQCPPVSNIQEIDAPHIQTVISSNQQNVLPNDDNVVSMMTDCSMDASDYNSMSGFTSAIPSSSSSEYPPQQCFLPPPPSPSQQPVNGGLVCHQPNQLPDIMTSKVVEEFEKIMRGELDKVVLTNSICLLFRFSIDAVQGREVCQAMSASAHIMSRLYYVLNNDQFEDDDLILCYATGNLTNISKYEEGRATLLGYDPSRVINQYSHETSEGVHSLLRSLRSRDSNVVIFAITAIHNLLLDRRIVLQDIAKEQIKIGIKFIVQLLDNRYLINNYEFKVIVLDCLQILAYGNRENRLAIKESRGPYLLLRTINENLKTNDQPYEELIETASRVLKSLSACQHNKIDIIENGGINILTQCISRNNHEILKTCLWTLRNLSDVISNSEQDYEHCVNQLVERLLHILCDYSEVPCIIICALGILSNLTCNNETIKQFICESNGINIILKTIEIALSSSPNIYTVDKEIIEPAICTLCHLMNQTLDKSLATNSRLSVIDKLDMLKSIMTGKVTDDLSKAVKKLVSLTLIPYCKNDK